MWYFTGGGMILWFIDRLIRFYKSAKVFTASSIRVLCDGEVTEVILQPNENFAFSAGQYAFVNIPSITPLEWHPFTISSSPGENDLKFHIKNMGKDTWTARLARLYSCDRPFSPPIINIDGPYGSPPSVLKYETLLLVAGGIGITPLISTLRHQYQLHKNDHPHSRHIKNIYLIWVVRDTLLLEMFRDVFDDIASNSQNQSKFHISLRVTQRIYSKTYSASVTNTTPVLLDPQPIMGRPNLQQEFDQVALAANGGSVLAMVCGPPVMVAEVQNAAFRNRFELHTETFEL